MAEADKIQFFRKDDIIILEGNAQFSDESTQASGAYIKFNSVEEKIWIDGTGELQKDELFLAGEKIFFDGKLNKGKSEGNVVSEDKVSGRKIYSDYLSQTNDNDYLAYTTDGRPYIEEIMENDTLFLSADTLMSVQKVDSLDTFRIFKAYNDVRLFSNSFQGISDSLIYDTKDSTFIFYGSPVLWSDTTQFIADTIVLNNDEIGIDKVYLKNKSFIVNKLGVNYYDQIKGKNIFAKLDSSKIEWMEVKGNAQVIYLLRDDRGAFIGANKTECSNIEFTFEKNDLKDIKFRSKPTSKMVPVQKALKVDLFLDGFDWKENLRPISLQSILDKEKLTIETPEHLKKDSFELEVLDVLEKIKSK